jgi:hypothetical protein
MRDCHQYAAEHMIRLYGLQEARWRARALYFGILGDAGVIFWADVMVAVNAIARARGLDNGAR